MSVNKNRVPRFKEVDATAKLLSNKSVPDGAKNRYGHNEAELRNVGVEIASEYLGLKPESDKPYEFMVGKMRVKVEVRGTLSHEVGSTGGAWVKEDRNAVERDVDAFLFIRVNPTSMKSWVTGWMPVKEYYTMSRYVEYGDRVYCRDAKEFGYRMSVRHLRDPEELLNGGVADAKKSNAWRRPHGK